MMLGISQINDSAKKLEQFQHDMSHKLQMIDSSFKGQFLPQLEEFRSQLQSIIQKPAYPDVLDLTKSFEKLATNPQWESPSNY